MKRLLIIHPHDPSIHHVGGIGTFINNAVKYCPPDFEISLVGVSTDPEKVPLRKWQKVEAGGRKVDFLPLVSAHPNFHGRFPLMIRFAWALWRHRRLIDFTNAIVELHRIEPELALKGLQNSKVLFYHTHTRDLYNPKTEVFWRKFPWLYFWLEERLIARMDQLYSVREDTIAWYRARYPFLRVPFFFLPTWVDEQVFRSFPESERTEKKEELMRAQGLDPRNRLLLFVGRFELQKDPFLLIESFRRLNQRMSETNLVMIGGGSLEFKLRDLIQSHGLSEKIRLIAPQPPRVIADWMNAADCLALTSAYEGMPRVAVEALRCGLPVVAVEEGEESRLIRAPGTGRLVSGRDPEVIGEAFAEVLRERPDREACQKNVTPFGAEKVLSGLFSHYRSLEKKKPSYSSFRRFLAGIGQRFSERGVENALTYAIGRFYFVRSLCLAVNRRLGRRPNHDLSQTLFRGVDIEKAMEELRQNAFFPGLDLPAGSLKEIYEFAKNSRCFSPIDGRRVEYFLPERASLEKENGGKPIFVAYCVDPARACPAIARIENDPLVCEMTYRYMGKPRKIETLLWWSFATKASEEERLWSRQQTVQFHYDAEGFLLLYFNFYLTQVDGPLAGPHVLVRGSHGKKKLRHLLGTANRTDEEIVQLYGADRIITICGPAGSGFAEDAYCYHKASPPPGKDRLFLQVRMLV